MMVEDEEEFFFFKQQTAYEMRISDWSSDVCSSDLLLQALAHVGRPHVLADHDAETHAAKVHRAGQRPCAEHALLVEHAVVRQVVLGAVGGYAAAVDHVGGVEPLAEQRRPCLSIAAPGADDDQAGPAVGGIPRQRPESILPD